MSMAITILVEILESVVPLIVSYSAIRGMWEIVEGLRAKRAAKALLERKNDRKLAYIAKVAAKRTLRDEEVRVAIERIQELIDEMPESKQAYVERGLHQKSRSGERRYVGELISNPRPA